MTTPFKFDRKAHAYRSWLPRLTRSALWDLWIWMAGFGLLVGVLFPVVVMVLGVPSEYALRPIFFVAALIAGLVAAVVNVTLTRIVVGVRLRSLASSMQQVEESLTEAAYDGDWSKCDPETCAVLVDSQDELGEAAESFNKLIASLATSHQISDAITSIGRALSEHLDLETLAEDALGELQVRTGADAAALLVIRKGRLELAGTLGLQNAEALLSSLSVKGAADSGDARNFHLPKDVVINAGLVDFQPSDIRIDPVRFGVVTVGVLVTAFSHEPGPETAAVIEGVLPNIAVAVNNSLNYEDLQRVAALDQLTGMYNRRFGLRRIKEEFGRTLRSGDPLGLLMFDIDHFKAINDTYGHLVGDRVLQSVATAAKAALREGDVLMRYGGEEFVVALPGAGRDDMTNMAERVRRAVSDLDIQDGSSRIHVTISVGGCAYPNPNATGPQDLIGIADEALYTAKASGRDRSVIV